MGGGEFAVSAAQASCRHLCLQIDGQLVDDELWSGFIKTSTYFRKALGCGNDQADIGDGGAVVRQLREFETEIAQHCCKRAGFITQREFALGLVALVLKHHGGEQCFLRREVGIDRALGHASCGHDVVHAGAVKTLGEEAFAGTIEDLGAFCTIQLRHVGEGFGHVYLPCCVNLACHLYWNRTVRS